MERVGDLAGSVCVWVGEDERGRDGSVAWV